MSKTRNVKGASPAIPTRGKLGRREFIKVSAAAGAVAAGLAGGARRPRAQGRTEITFASAKFFSQDIVADMLDAYNQSQGKVLVKYQELPPPSSSTEVHQALVQRLSRRGGGIDVFTQDVIWIAEFSEAGWSLPLDEYFGADEMANYFPGLVDACTWKGKLAALPWYVDSGMLYYRKDLLERIGAPVPETWAQLKETGAKIQAAGLVDWGYAWQGKQAEVLVTDLVSIIASHNGAILAPDGVTVRIAEQPAIDAVSFLHDTIKSGLSPRDVLSWDEEPSRRPFSAGQFAFLRNWSYAWSVSQDPEKSKVVDKIGVAPLPHIEGAPSAACLGGYQYGVDASSKKREASIDFLTWMSSPKTQLRFASLVGLAPTRPAVFEAPELKKTQPFMVALKDVFVGATGRPVTPKYPQISLVIQSAGSNALVYGDIAGALKKAKKRIEEILA